MTAGLGPIHLPGVYRLPTRGGAAVTIPGWKHAKSRDLRPTSRLGQLSVIPSSSPPAPPPPPSAMALLTYTYSKRALPLLS
jgi:hypothetical protein